MANKAGPMRDALKRKMAPPPEEPSVPESEDFEEAPAIDIAMVKKAGPEGSREDVGGSEEALAGLEPCIAKLPPEQADEARQLVDRLADLFKNYEQEPEEEAPVELEKEPKSPLGEY